MTEKWYRVTFRNKEILVHGEAELERVKARKVPKVWGVTVAKVHQCSICGKREAWLDGWSWYGSYEDMDEGRPVLKFCSEHCQERHALRGIAGEAPPVEVIDNPLGDQDHWQTRDRVGVYEPEKELGKSWKRQHDARQAANVRKFPFPEFPKERSGDGWCRWCGNPVQKPARTWHSDCLHEYRLHTDAKIQMDFLAERDGLQCAIRQSGWTYRSAWGGESTMTIKARQRGGKVTWGEQAWSNAGEVLEDVLVGQACMITMRSRDANLEVDHIVPLWKVAALPDDERRRFFGPENLWLLSGPMHKAKTKREAAERAAARQDPVSDSD